MTPYELPLTGWLDYRLVALSLLIAMFASFAALEADIDRRVSFLRDWPWTRERKWGAGRNSGSRSLLLSCLSAGNLHRFWTEVSRKVKVKPGRVPGGFWQELTPADGGS